MLTLGRMLDTVTEATAAATELYFYINARIDYSSGRRLRSRGHQCTHTGAGYDSNSLTIVLCISCRELTPP